MINMIRYKCRNCGAILYEHNKSDHCGLLTPREVAMTLGCVCPVCKSPLNPDTSNPDWREHIIIKPAKAKSKHEKHVRNSRTEKPTSGDLKGVRFITSTEFIIEEL